MFLAAKRLLLEIPLGFSRRSMSNLTLIIECTICAKWWVSVGDFKELDRLPS